MIILSARPQNEWYDKEIEQKKREIRKLEEEKALYELKSNNSRVQKLLGEIIFEIEMELLNFPEGANIIIHLSPALYGALRPPKTSLFSAEPTLLGQPVKVNEYLDEDYMLELSVRKRSKVVSLW